MKSKSEDKQKGNKGKSETKKMIKKDKAQKEKVIEKDKTKKIKEEKIINDEPNEIKTKKIRKTVSKQKSVLIVSLVVFLYTAIILLTNLVLLQDPIYNFDTTYSQMYKLSKKSKEIIKSVDENIEININKKLNYTQVNEILKEITSLNSYITVNYTDDTDTSSKDSDKYYTTIFIMATDREYLAVSFFDLNYDGSLIDKDNYKQYSVLEQKFINSIISIIKGDTNDTPSVAFLTSIDGPEISEELINLYTELRAYGILSITIDLNKDELPDTIDTIAIIGPSKDITKETYNKLIDFQARGGNFVIGATLLEDNSLPIFTKLVASYGVQIPVGAVLDYKDGYRYTILDGDTKDDVSYNNILLPLPTDDNDITKEMDFEGTSPLFIFPTKLVLDTEEELEKKNVTYINHILSSDKAIFKTGDIVEEDVISDEPKNAETETYILGTIATKGITEDISSTAVIYSNYFFMTDLAINNLIDNEIILQKDNLRLSRNTFTYLHYLKEEMLSIKKGLIVSPYKYNIQKAPLHKIIMIILFAIPVIIIIVIGFFVIFKRGHLSKFGLMYVKRTKKTKIEKNKK